MSTSAVLLSCCIDTAAATPAPCPVTVQAIILRMAACETMSPATQRPATNHAGRNTKCALRLVSRALAMIGRGTFDASEWDEALEEATEEDANSIVDQLLDMPMLAGYLDAGLTAFDLSCDGMGQID